MGRPYTRGIHEIGDGIFAWLQPHGGWGWSNAGLVTDGDASLLVDTLFDEHLTREMLTAMRAASPAAHAIDVLVNTHANGDHTFGNRLVGEARIVASKASADEMEALPPATLARMMRAAPDLGDLGSYLTEIFGAFDFEGIPPTPPTETFSDFRELRVGDRRIELHEVGPAHTSGDVLVHVPDDRVVYTGDILFIDGTPIIWAGPVANWLRALDKILAFEAETIVPGHGPLTDRAGVTRVRDYLEFISREATARFEAGMTPTEAARDIDLGEFASWRDAERLAVNVHTLYREHAPATPEPSVFDLFREMADLRRR